MERTDLDPIISAGTDSTRLLLEHNNQRTPILVIADDAPPKIAIGLFVARKISFDPSFDILGVSDEIYQEIALPEDRLRSPASAQ